MTTKQRDRSLIMSGFKWLCVEPGKQWMLQDGTVWLAYWHREWWLVRDGDKTSTQQRMLAEAAAVAGRVLRGTAEMPRRSPLTFTPVFLHSTSTRVTHRYVRTDLRRDSRAYVGLCGAWATGITGLVEREVTCPRCLEKEAGPPWLR